MFFYISKLLVPLESPGDLLLALLAAGTLLSWFSRTRRTGIVLTSIAALAFLAVAVFPIARWITSPLEDRFPRPRQLPDRVDGLIVLGGAVDPDTTARRGLPTLNGEAERMTEFVRLAKSYPGARLVFSGGSALLSAHPVPKEAGVARIFFRQQGLDVRRILFEDRSRNTYENVLLSKALAKPRRGETWLLVQSAHAVPRSIGIFHRLGWPVIPVPVAYKTSEAGGFDLGYDLADSLMMVENSSHDWLGLLVYRLTGKTDALFPSPQNP
jgi:uncharacterized SAM-binding protein YcdF (DUF218 family)